MENIVDDTKGHGTSGNFNSTSLSSYHWDPSEDAVFETTDSENFHLNQKEKFETLIQKPLFEIEKRDEAGAVEDISQIPCKPK